MNNVLWIGWCVLAADVIMSSIGWHGLTWGGRRWLLATIPALIGATLALVLLPITIHWPTAIFGGLLGTAISAGLALWRRRRLTMDQLYVPGEGRERRIVEIAIPIEGGPLPALLIEPRGGSAISVLIVHGAGNHKTFYAWPLLYGLADAGYAACAIDVDGHGANPRSLDFPDVLDDVRAGVAWLRERYPSVVVLGISQGGCIAARAVAEGVAVDGVAVLEAPITIAVTKAVIRWEARTLALPATWALHRDVGTWDIVRGWRSVPVRTNIGTAALIERLDLLGSVARISCPLLLCYAGSDAVVPIAQGRRVAAAAPPTARFVIIPRATHLSLSIDRRMIRCVTAWLHTLPTPATHNQTDQIEVTT